LLFSEEEMRSMPAYSLLDLLNQNVLCGFYVIARYVFRIKLSENLRIRLNKNALRYIVGRVTMEAELNETVHIKHILFKMDHIPQ
jgi:hypothetical protein